MFSAYKVPFAQMDSLTQDALSVCFGQKFIKIRDLTKTAIKNLRSLQNRSQKGAGAE